MQNVLKKIVNRLNRKTVHKWNYALLGGAGVLSPLAIAYALSGNLVCCAACVVGVIGCLRSDIRDPNSLIREYLNKRS